MFDDAIRCLEQAVENLKQRRLVLANVKLPPAATVLDAVEQLQQMGLEKGSVSVTLHWGGGEESRVRYSVFDDRPNRYELIGGGPTLAVAISEAYGNLNPAPSPTPLEQSAALCEALPDERDVNDLGLVSRIGEDVPM
jgi:hypothetical protein